MIVPREPAKRFPDVRVMVFTFEPKRPNVYAPTTSAKTRVPAIKMIVAMTGVTPLLLLFILRVFVFMSQESFRPNNRV